MARPLQREGRPNPTPVNPMASQFPQLAFNEWLERALEKLLQRGLTLPQNR